VFLLISDAAREVVRLETGQALPTQQQDCQAYLRHYCQDNTGLIQLLNNHDWLSCVASGSGAPTRMVICPCSMGTLAAVACGLSNNLIERRPMSPLKNSIN
jgi:4-hydroxy-3-polyprenylbenzoate decarboxylase